MAPSNILIDQPNEKHRQEWLDSAVSELIIDANLHTITDHRTINHLLGWKTPKGAAGKQTKDDRTCWAVWGKNPLDKDTAYFGLQIKPDFPRNNPEGKPIKYESSFGKGSANQPLFLKVPDPIWEQISTKWAVPILPEDYEKGFWQWVLNKTQIPILITEGAKKAGALLTHGYVTISIAGVSNGQYLGALNPYIAPFCPVGRKAVLAYDSDLHSKESVRKELDRLGRLIATSGAVPHVMQWAEDLAKGIDDFIAEFGGDALDRVYTEAKTFEAYRREAKDNPEKIEPEEIENELHFNQIAIATIYKDQLYVCINEVLHRWTGTHYEPSSDAAEKRRIFRFCNTYTVYDPRFKKNFYKYANSTSVNSVLEWFKSSCHVDIDQVCTSGINLLNGILTIEWKGRVPHFTLKKHSPDIIYTYVSRVKYDPDADPTYCDRLLSVLEPAQQQILLKVIASTLDLASVRAKAINRSVRCLLLKGDGNNGKDALRECVSEIFGKQSITTCGLSDFRAYDTGNKFDLARLAFSRINWSPENADSLLLDKLDVIKRIVTGDTIDIVFKREDAKPLDPCFAMLFNINKMPAFSGAQEAIKSRYAILSFNKTIVKNADPDNPNQIEGDPRYKYDPEFRQTQVAPALLNRLLKALKDLMADGIDYSSCDAAIQSAREDSCHLLRWAKEIGLEYGKGKIRIGDLFNDLEQWYVDTGVLEIEEKSTGGKKCVWIEEGDRYDPFVKSSRLMRSALAKVFPNVTFSERTMHGVFVFGIQSKKFCDLPNFGSFESSENQNKEGESNTGHDPNYDPNNFESSNNFGSLTISKRGHDPNDPSAFDHDSKKADNHAGYASNIANDPNQATANSTQPPLKIENCIDIFSRGVTPKIGDKVDFFKYKLACEKFHRIRHLPDSHYTITELATNQGILQATIKHPNLRASLVVAVEWLMPAWEKAS